MLYWRHTGGIIPPSVSSSAVTSCVAEDAVCSRWVIGWIWKFEHYQESCDVKTRKSSYVFVECSDFHSSRVRTCGATINCLHKEWFHLPSCQIFQCPRFQCCFPLKTLALTSSVPKTTIQGGRNPGMYHRGGWCQHRNRTDSITFFGGWFLSINHLTTILWQSVSDPLNRSIHLSASKCSKTPSPLVPWKQKS